MTVPALECPALGGSVRLGHIDHAYDSRDFSWENDLRPTLAKLGALPKIPPNAGGHGNDQSEWPMSGNGPDPSGTTPLIRNQGCSDCEVAGKQNEIIEACINGNKAYPPMDATTAIPVYSTLTAKLNNGAGFDPVTGANDTGLTTAICLDYGQKVGYPDKTGKLHQIGPYFWGEPGNWLTYWEMAYFFEAAGIAWDFTTSMMDQFNANKPWTYVKGATSEGGHYTAGMGKLHTPCWTRNQGFTQKLYEAQNTEVSAFITVERFKNVTGETMEGYKDLDLEKFATQLAQGTVTNP